MSRHPVCLRNLVKSFIVSLDDPKRAQGLQDPPNQEERAVGRATVLIASCFWVAASLTPAWSAGPGQTQLDGDYVHGAFSLPYPFSLSDETDPSLYMKLKGLSKTPWQMSCSTILDETVPEFQGVKARYEISLGNYSFEFSGGYVPVMKSLVPSESFLDPRAHLGYVNFTIPFSQFYFKGGAFFGRNEEALGLIFKRPPEAQDAEKRELFGYQISGGYRFSDSLSIQAGWGQAAQEYRMKSEGLGTWYLQAQISPGWGMSVIPQVGFVDLTSGDGEKLKEDFYFGARWHINF
jgi:hypothetical protein